MQPNDNDKPNFMYRFGQELFRLTAYVTFITFYYFFVEDDGDIILTTPLKCAPIVSLGVYVYLKGFKLTDEFRYSHLIMAGLIFSCIGDFFLNIDHFPQGMGAFAIAQGFYINAFELKPLMPYVGVPLYLLGAGMIMYIFNSLDLVIKIGLPIYGALLITMCWRCIVRAIVKGGVLAPFCALGSILFVISDTAICINMFISPIPNARGVIMSTYYTAQLLIAISTMSDVLKPKKAKGSKKLSRKFRAQD